MPVDSLRKFADRVYQVRDIQMLQLVGPNSQDPILQASLFRDRFGLQISFLFPNVGRKYQCNSNSDKKYIPHPRIILYADARG